MDYGMIGKIEKAKQYAKEPQRVTLSELEVAFQGSNDHYTVRLDSSGWHCSCPGFESHQICPHIMALERLLNPLLKRPALPYAHGQNIISDVEKATRYAHEKDRIRFTSFTGKLDGANNAHEFIYTAGHWQCNCDFFHSRHVCSHTMALEKILHGMITVQTPTP